MRIALRVLLYLGVFLVADRVIDAALDVAGVGLGYGIRLRVVPAAAIAAAVISRWPPRSGSPAAAKPIGDLEPLPVRDASPEEGICSPQPRPQRRRMWLSVVLVCAAMTAVGLMMAMLPRQPADPTERVTPGHESPDSLEESQPPSAELARLYFQQMKPAIRLDYSTLRQFNKRQKEIEDWTGSGRRAYLEALRAFLKGNENALVAYSLVDPPPEFKSAHRLLLLQNRLVLDWEQVAENNLSRQRPYEEWQSRYSRRLGANSKTVNPANRVRGFESPPLRQMQHSSLNRAGLRRSCIESETRAKCRSGGRQSPGWAADTEARHP